MSSRTNLAVVLGSVLSAAVIAFAPSAQASDVEIDRDTCGSAASGVVYRLKVSDDEDYRLTVTFAVFSDDEDTWDWRLLHNGDGSARGESQARDADRSFRVIRRMIDAPGIDEVVFRAENRATGLVCRGALTL